MNELSVTDLLRERASFEVGLRFEVCFALELLVDPRSRLHPQWKHETLRQLPASFHRALSQGAGAPVLWAGFPDVLEAAPAQLDVPQVVDRVAALPLDEYQRRSLVALLHSAALVADLMHGRRTLRQCLARAPKDKLEWLAFIGLYPLDEARPEAKAVAHLLDDPGSFRAATLEALTLFWEAAFRRTWEELVPALERSAAEKERLFLTCSFAEFAQQGLLRVEVDERRRRLRAIRGGFSLDVERVGACHFMPSAFNDRRYWTSFERPDGRVELSFPYFDPALAPAGPSSRPAARAQPPPPVSAPPPLDPTLVLRALADSTRYAIAGLLAASPRSAADLARALSISKAAVSGHVSKLREAGLLGEAPAGGAIRLSLKREVLEGLSELLVTHLFERSARSAPPPGAGAPPPPSSPRSTSPRRSSP